jgi:hypothetical protein
MHGSRAYTTSPSTEPAFVTRLEDFKAGVWIKGLTPEGTVEVVSVEWYGDRAIQVIYRDGGGGVKNRLLYRDEKSFVSIATTGGAWTFDGDGAMLRLVSEAMRIRLAYLFDPYLAIHTSHIEPCRTRSPPPTARCSGASL